MFPMGTTMPWAWCLATRESWGVERQERDGQQGGHRGQGEAREAPCSEASSATQLNFRCYEYGPDATTARQRLTRTAYGALATEEVPFDDCPPCASRGGANSRHFSWPRAGAMPMYLTSTWLHQQCQESTAF